VLRFLLQESKLSVLLALLDDYLAAVTAGGMPELAVRRELREAIFFAGGAARGHCITFESVLCVLLLPIAGRRRRRGGPV
jgi:hypothetical protein